MIDIEFHQKNIHPSNWLLDTFISLTFWLIADNRRAANKHKLCYIWPINERIITNPKMACAIHAENKYLAWAWQRRQNSYSKGYSNWNCLTCQSLCLRRETEEKLTPDSRWSMASLQCGYRFHSLLAYYRSLFCKLWHRYLRLRYFDVLHSVRLSQSEKWFPSGFETEQIQLENVR